MARSLPWLALWWLLAACPAPEGEGAPQPTDTPAPEPTGDTGPATTEPPTETGETGTPTLPELQVPGCPPAFTPVPADLAGCTSRSTARSRYGWASDAERTYDDRGRLASEVTHDAYDHTLRRFEYDPLTGDLVRTFEDLNLGEGMYRTVAVTDATWTRDAQGRVIAVDRRTVSSFQGLPTGVDTERVEFTWGACGVEVERSSNGPVWTFESYVDGTRETRDADADGVPETWSEQVVDPATGFPVEHRHGAFGEAAPEGGWTDVRDPATGWLLGREERNGDIEVAWRWSYDPEGRQLTEYRESWDADGYGGWSHTDTVWTCPR